jgi:hypothetical protein
MHAVLMQWVYGNLQLTYHMCWLLRGCCMQHTQVLHLGQMQAGRTLGMQRTVSPLPRDEAHPITEQYVGAIVLNADSMQCWAGNKTGLGWSWLWGGCVHGNDGTLKAGCLAGVLSKPAAACCSLPRCLRSCSTCVAAQLQQRSIWRGRQQHVGSVDAGHLAEQQQLGAKNKAGGQPTSFGRGLPTDSRVW